MKTLYLLLILFFFISSSSFAQIKADSIFVANSQELRAAIKSNRVIIITTDHIKLSDEEFILDEIVNLEIRNSSSKQTRITTANAGNTVITLKNTRNISLNNLSIGHWPDEGYCQGNVLDFFDCDSTFIDKCDLFGSGVIGLYLRRSNIWCSNTVIRDCSEDVLDVDFGRSSLVFNKCRFYLNPSNKVDYPEPFFENCAFFNHDGIRLNENYAGFYPKKPLLIQAEQMTEYSAWSGLLNDNGELESVCPNTFSVSASSNLKPYKGITYESKNLNEVASATGENSAWVEGVSDNGIGQSLFFKLKSMVADYEPWAITGEFRIINGYAKDLKTWQNNNRVKKIMVLRNNKTVAYVNLIDTPNLQSFHLQDVFYKNQLTIGETLEFRIIEVFKGDKFNDTALTYFSASCAP